MKEVTLQAIKEILHSSFDKKIDIKLESLKKVLDQQTILLAEIEKNLGINSLPH